MTNEAEGTPRFSRSLDAPRLYASEFPDDEREAARHLINNLSKYIGLVDDFQNTLDLFIISAGWRRQVSAEIRRKFESDDYNGTPTLDNDRRRLEGWVNIAARHGAMLAFSCSELKANDKKYLLPVCRSIHGRIDQELIDASNTVFDAAFPDVRDIRLSAAHPSELGSYMKNYDKHALKGEVDTGLVDVQGDSMGMIDGQITVSGDQVTYSATIKGAYVGYTLSPYTLEQLAESVRLYLAAFEPAVTQR